MRRYKLMIAYDGSAYSGWQVQPNGISIQEKIEDAFLILFKRKIPVIGSGRTDAGVHALKQIAHFDMEDERLDLRKLLYSLNGILPASIRILAILPVAMSFHAQHSAKKKCYWYYLNLDTVKSPFHIHTSWHISRNLDRSAMKEAAKRFIGTHDFTSFSNQPHLGACSADPIRTLERIDFTPWEFGLKLEFEGNGFLYKMVRNIVGTLYETGIGKIDVKKIPSIFEARDRKSSGRAAPAHGLFLAYVTY